MSAIYISDFLCRFKFRKRFGIDGKPVAEFTASPLIILRRRIQMSVIDSLWQTLPRLCCRDRWTSQATWYQQHPAAVVVELTPRATNIGRRYGSMMIHGPIYGSSWYINVHHTILFAKGGLCHPSDSLWILVKSCSQGYAALYCSSGKNLGPAGVCLVIEARISWMCEGCGASR